MPTPDRTCSFLSVDDVADKTSRATYKKKKTAPIMGARMNGFNIYRTDQIDRYFMIYIHLSRQMYHCLYLICKIVRDHTRQAGAV